MRHSLWAPSHSTWARFRGRLPATDLLALLFEDAAVLHRIPFDPAALGDALMGDVPLALVGEMLVCRVELCDLLKASRPRGSVIGPGSKVICSGGLAQLAPDLNNARRRLMDPARATVPAPSW